MKKTLIAMAVLAASGASFAQVTIYGVLNGGYQNSKASVTSAGVTTDTRADGFVNNSGGSTNRIGFKGTEDLGGGMAANFVLEGTANTADGTNTAGSLFDRNSTVGLSGGFGAVRIGRSYTPLFLTIIAGDPFGVNGVRTSNYYPVGTAAVRSSNAIFYNTPALGGFKAAAMYGTLDTGASVSTGGSTPAKVTNTGLSGGYANGPLALSLGFGWQDGDAAGPVASKSTGQGLSGSYDFGPAKLFASYAQGRVTADTSLDNYTDNNETNLGVSVPFGAVVLTAALGRNSQTTVVSGAETPHNTGTGNDWTLGATYNLSKRTSAFVRTGVQNKFNFGATAGTGTSNSQETTTSAIGINHSF